MKTRIQVIWATASGRTQEELDSLKFHGREPVTSKTFEADLDSGLDDLAICESLYENTNQYEGPLWDAMQPLPDSRTHTSISVGDYVVIDDRMYRCASIGWERTNTFIPGLGFREPTPDEDQG